VALSPASLCPEVASSRREDQSRMFTTQEEEVLPTSQPDPWAGPPSCWGGGPGAVTLWGPEGQSRGQEEQSRQKSGARRK
jgi:hypothetical protein